MKKMNKLAIVLVLAVVLIAASSAVVLAYPIPGTPGLPETCEVNFGFGILQRLFPRFNELIQNRGCRLPLP